MQEVYLHFVKATWLHMGALNSLPAARASKSANTLVGGCIFTFLIKRWHARLYAQVNAPHYLAFCLVCVIKYIKSSFVTVQYLQQDSALAQSAEHNLMEIVGNISQSMQTNCRFLRLLRRHPIRSWSSNHTGFLLRPPYFPKLNPLGPWRNIYEVINIFQSTHQSWMLRMIPYPPPFHPSSSSHMLYHREASLHILKTKCCKWWWLWNKQSTKIWQSLFFKNS